MADRKKILWGITEPEDKLFLSKMCDIAERSFYSGRIMFSRFLNPREIILVKSKISGEFCVNFSGGFDGAARCIAAFGESYEKTVYPLCALRIRTKSRRQLSHRDCLGGVLSLGIDRAHIGDIVVTDECTVMIVTEEIRGYIEQNFIRAGNDTLLIDDFGDPAVLGAQIRYSETGMTVSSLRADCVISAFTGKSRAKAAELIESGVCSVNYDEVKSANAHIENGDILSVRGFGKAEIFTDGTLTKKGRIRINIKKYI